MNRRGLHVLAALGLVISLFAATFASGSAQVTGPYEVYFPWVPNGATIDDPREDFGQTGPYYGSITIQNLENAEVDVTYEITATGDTDDFTLDPLGSMSLNTATLFDGIAGVDGSGVHVTAVAAEDLGDFTEGDPVRIAGVQKQAADTALDADARTSASHETVAGYTGLTEEEISDFVVLPIAQTNNNWNTLIRATNFDDATESDITVSFRPAGGSGWQANFTVDDVDPGETATFDLLDLAPPGEWVGSAVVTADVNVGAVAERVKNETNMLIMNVSRVMPENGNEQHAPLVFNNYNFWNTGISLANLSDQDNDVTITYYDLDGNVENDEDLTLPADGMQFVYTPATDENGDEFIGSAIIEAESPIAGAVDEVKYFGDDLDTGHAMSYMIEDHPAALGESLAMPLIQKGTVVDNVASGDTSGIHLFNTSDQVAVVGISYLDQDGNEELSELHLLGGREGLTSYTVDENLPDDFQGSAIIQVVLGDGSIVAASNIVNYDVQFDGSGSFNLVHTGLIDLELPDPEEELLEEITIE